MINENHLYQKLQELFKCNAITAIIVIAAITVVAFVGIIIYAFWKRMCLCCGFMVHGESYTIRTEGQTAIIKNQAWNEACKKISYETIDTI